LKYENGCFKYSNVTHMGPGTIKLQSQKSVRIFHGFARYLHLKSR
jgi:hypothetical protein